MKRFSINISKSLTRLLLISAPLTCCFSCTKNLMEPSNPISISSENAFDNPDRILAQVNDLYAKIKVGNFRGGKFTIHFEIRGDEFIVNIPNPFTGVDIWNQNVNSATTHVINLWSACYTAINSCNVFLDGLENNRDKLDGPVFDNYSGEAKFIRALTYYSLLQFYANPYAKDGGASPGVPLRLLPEKGVENNDLARSTVKDVYQQIINDLNDAEAMLPLRHGTALLNTTRAQRNAAIALKTRVYLSMGDYDNVITEAAKIVSDVPPFRATSGVENMLEPNLTALFSGSYTGTEAMLFLPFTNADALPNQNPLSYYYSPAPTGNAEYFLNPEGIFSDPVFSTPSDARSGLISMSGGNAWLAKFKSPSPWTDYVPVIRYAEVLLNYAEAAAMTDDVPKAVALLTAVRKRADPGYEFSAGEVAQKENIVSTILNERRIELLGEGFRVADLQRRLQTIPGKAGLQGVSPSVSVSSPNYIWPISGNELATNKLCEPNP